MKEVKAPRPVNLKASYVKSCMASEVVMYLMAILTIFFLLILLASIRAVGNLLN